MAKTVKKRKPPAVKKSTKTSARAARPGVKKPTKGNLPSFHHAELDNGLQIIAECHPHMHSAAMGFYVRTGARDETPELAGVSHFLEHMIFKGTERRSADDVNREFDDMGAYCNAFTSDEITGYYSFLLPEYLEGVIELWSDLLRPALRPDDFFKEQQVILEEILMYLDQPPYCADDLCKSIYFGSHPLANSVLGTQESVSALTPDAMRAYQEARYSSQNMVLAATGKIDFDQLVAWADQYCGHWKPQPAPRQLSMPKIHPGFQVVHKPSSAQQYALLLSDSPSSVDEARCAARLMTIIVGDDSGSRMYWDMVDSGMAESANMSTMEYLDCGCVMTFLGCSPENINANLQRIFEIQRTVEADGVTQAELDQARSKLFSHLVFRSEIPRGRLTPVVYNWLYRHEYQSLAHDLDRLSRITVDDIMTSVRRHPLSINTTIVVGPETNVMQPK